MINIRKIKFSLPKLLIYFIRIQYFCNQDVRRLEFLYEIKRIRNELLERVEKIQEKNFLNSIIDDIIINLDSKYLEYLDCYIPNMDELLKEYEVVKDYYFKRMNFNISSICNLINVNKEDKLLSFDLVNDVYNYNFIYLYNFDINPKIIDESFYYYNILRQLLINLAKRYYKSYNYETNYYDKIINLSTSLDLFESNSKLREKYSDKSIDLANIKFTLDSLKSSGKAVIFVSNSFLSSNKYFLDRLELIENKYIECVINLRNDSLVVLSKCDKEYIRFVNYDSSDVYRYNLDFKDIVSVSLSKNETIYTRNIDYSTLIKESRKLVDKYNYYQSLNHRIDDVIDDEEIRFESIKKASLLARDYINHFEEEFKSIESLKDELNDCYKELSRLLNNR
jgi:hypothetical protein